MSTILLTAVTAAGQSREVSVTKDNLPYTFSMAPVLDGTELAQVQFKDGAGTWSDLYVDGILQELGATNSMITMFGPGNFRVDKESSATATAVYGQSHGNM